MKWLGWIAVCVAAACSQSDVSVQASDGFTLVASTPCDAEIKRMLTIPAERRCDFIRWKLTLAKTFVLTAEFGEARPNTPGFVPVTERLGTYDGELLELNGNVEVDKADGHEEWRLISTGQRQAKFALLRLNENLFHILNSERRLMRGNGGWSYTLNRTSPVPAGPLSPPSISNSRRPPASVTFDGRTPCRELAPMVGIPIGQECFKIKWRVILNRDPSTLEPTTYQIQSTFARTHPIDGKWRIEKGIAGDAAAVVYRLDGNKPILLTPGDENILFFLNTERQPLTGNADFSYTLNRKPD